MCSRSESKPQTSNSSVSSFSFLLGSSLVYLFYSFLLFRSYFHHESFPWLTCWSDSSLLITFQLPTFLSNSSLVDLILFSGSFRSYISRIVFHWLVHHGNVVLNLGGEQLLLLICLPFCCSTI